MGSTLDIGILAALGLGGLYIYSRRCEIPGVATLAGCPMTDPAYKAGEAVGQTWVWLTGGGSGTTQDFLVDTPDGPEMFGDATGKTPEAFCSEFVNQGAPICASVNPSPVDYLLGGLRSLRWW